MTALACVDPDRIFIDRLTGCTPEEIAARYHVPLAYVLKCLSETGGAVAAAPAPVREFGARQRRPMSPPGRLPELGRAANGSAKFSSSLTSKRHLRLVGSSSNEVRSDGAQSLFVGSANA